MVARVEPVPADRIHRVRRGETLTSIARRYGVTEAEIVAANQLRSRNVIVVGQRLRLPGAAEPLARTHAGLASDRRRGAGAAAPKPARPRPRRLRRPPSPLRRRLRTPAPEAPRVRSAAPRDAGAAAAQIAAPTARDRRRCRDTRPVETPEARRRAPARRVAPAPIALASAAAERAPPGARRRCAARARRGDAAALDASAAPDAEPSAASEPESSAPPAPDPSNYAVSSGNRITVQADETLGHYAEWLEVRAERAAAPQPA